MDKHLLRRVSDRRISLSGNTKSADSKPFQQPGAGDPCPNLGRGNSLCPHCLPKQTPHVAFSAARYSATSAVPQTPPSVHDGSADKNPGVTLQKVVINTGRRGNLRGVDEKKALRSAGQNLASVFASRTCGVARSGCTCASAVTSAKRLTSWNAGTRSLAIVG